MIIKWVFEDSKTAKPHIGHIHSSVIGDFYHRWYLMLGGVQKHTITNFKSDYVPKNQ